MDLNTSHSGTNILEERTTIADTTDDEDTADDEDTSDIENTAEKQRVIYNVSIQEITFQ